MNTQYGKAAAVAALLALGCSASEGRDSVTGSPGGAGGSVNPGTGGSGGIDPSGGAGGGTPGTTVSGKVFDPSGRLPLYNVIVYVPREALDPIPDGVSCGRCEGSTSGKPVAATLSLADGSFVLENVPAGDNVPLVIQVGKWRREVTIPKVNPDVDNPITDPDLTRLPRNQSEGHLPQIALTTGHSDALECLLRKIGISDSEFTIDTGPGRVHMFVGCDGGNGYGANKFSLELGDAAFPPASDLWGEPAKLDRYDMLVLSCEGSQCESEKEDFKPNIKAYADKGGKLFLDHLHFNWVAEGPDPWPNTAGWIGTGTDLPSPFTASIDTTFEKGSKFSEWLVNVGASTAPGALEILEGQWSVTSHSPPMTQRWIYTDRHPTDSSGEPGVEYMTMNTPVELAVTDPKGQCGRIVYTDLHVVSASNDSSDHGTPFPGGCLSSELTAQEKALVFMLFDLSSCVMSEADKPDIRDIAG
jgi:hypothetical protein